MSFVIPPTPDPCPSTLGSQLSTTIPLTLDFHSMSQPIIEIQGIGKRYRIGATKEPYLSLRDEVAKEHSILKLYGLVWDLVPLDGAYPDH